MTGLEKGDDSLGVVLGLTLPPCGELWKTTQCIQGKLHIKSVTHHKTSAKMTSGHSLINTNDCTVQLKK